MFPEFFTALGFELYGRGFELTLWIAGVALGLWVLWAARGYWQRRQREHVALYGGVGLLLVGLCAPLAWWAGSDPEGYRLVLTQGLEVRTYALMTLLAFLLGSALAVRLGVREGFARRDLIDLAFWSLLAGLVGARGVFVLTSLAEYRDACLEPARLGLREADCLRAFYLWEGGQVFYGAVLGGGGAIAVFARRRGWSLCSLLDAVIPGLALGHAIGRVGCLGAGCCWGEVCTAGWGLRFGASSIPYLDQVDRLGSGDPAISPNILIEGATMPVHPTQLYDGAAELLIFALLLWWWPRRRASGEVFALWLLMYGAARMLIEVTRGDALRGYLWRSPMQEINLMLSLPETHVTFLSTSQLIGGLMTCVGGGFLLWLRREASTDRTQ